MLWLILVSRQAHAQRQENIKVYHFVSKLHKRPFCLCSRSRQAHIPRLKSKNGVISGKIPTFENFATKNSAEKQKMPKEKRAIGKRLSANALFFGFVFKSFYVVFQPVFFLFVCQVRSWAWLGGAKRRRLVSAKHTPTIQSTIIF